MRVLLTGAAGFIGMHTAAFLLERGDEVLGIDNLNDYYDINLKSARLAKLRDYSNFRFVNASLEHTDSLEKIFDEFRPDGVINLAAQAGVRYSLENPRAYIDANLVGFSNILECCRHKKVHHLVYASSSSVYGTNQKVPFSEHDNVDHPMSLYAATKKSNELLAHTYSHLFNLPTTGLRFFTVYGPWGRPDMALFLFTKAIIDGEPINVFNNGDMVRDFTYIDDIVLGVVKVLDKPAVGAETFDPLNPDPAASDAPYRIFNIGNGNPVPLLDYISALEDSLEIKAVKKFLPMQKGDVKVTSANTDELERWVGYRPKTPVDFGVNKFVEWYREYTK